MENTKCLIIGSGPAGYTAAIYAARADLKPVMYEGMEPGGQLTTTTEVDNFPGYPEGIEGPKMMEDLKKQAERFGTDIRWGMVNNVDTTKRPFKVSIDDGTELMAETIIIGSFNGCSNGANVYSGKPRKNRKTNNDRKYRTSA